MKMQELLLQENVGEELMELGRAYGFALSLIYPPNTRYALLLAPTPLTPDS